MPNSPWVDETGATWVDEHGAAWTDPHHFLTVLATTTATALAPAASKHAPLGLASEFGYAFALTASKHAPIGLAMTASQAFALEPHAVHFPVGLATTRSRAYARIRTGWHRPGQQDPSTVGRVAHPHARR